MNNEQIRTFLEVCEMGSFAKAANNLFVSNVAVLKQIKSLEKEFSVTLFRRGRKGCEITAEGKVFLKKAKQLVSLYNNIVIDLEECRHSLGVIRLGYDHRVGTDFLNGLSIILNNDQFRKVELVKCNYYNYFEAINDGIIDVAFVAKPSKQCPKSISFIKTIDAQYFALYRKDKNYFAEESICLSDLKDYDVYVTPLRYNDVYSSFINNSDKMKLHTIGIDEFIANEENGIYITTGLTKAISEVYELKIIDNFTGEWGIAFKLGNDKIDQKMIEQISNYFRK